MPISYEQSLNDAADAVAEPDLTCRTDDARPFLRPALVRRLHTGFRIGRLAYNSVLDADRACYRRVLRQAELGRNVARRQSTAEVYRGLAAYRASDPDFARLPVTTARLAADEARRAVDACVRRWARGEQGRYPRFRPAHGPQQVRLVQFGAPTLVRSRRGALHVQMRAMGTHTRLPLQFKRSAAPILLRPEPRPRNFVMVDRNNTPLLPGALVRAKQSDGRWYYGRVLRQDGPNVIYEMLSGEHGEMWSEPDHLIAA